MTVKTRNSRRRLLRAALSVLLMLLITAAYTLPAGFVYAKEEPEEEFGLPIREAHKVRVDDKKYCFFVQRNVVLTPEEIRKAKTDEKLVKEILKRAGFYMVESNCKRLTHKEITPKEWIKSGGSFLLGEEDINALRSADPSDGAPVKLYMDLGVSTSAIEVVLRPNEDDEEQTPADESSESADSATTDNSAAATDPAAAPDADNNNGAGNTTPSSEAAPATDQPAATDSAAAPDASKTESNANNDTAAQGASNSDSTASSNSNGGAESATPAGNETAGSSAAPAANSSASSAEGGAANPAASDSTGEASGPASGGTTGEASGPASGDAAGVAADPSASDAAADTTGDASEDDEPAYTVPVYSTYKLTSPPLLFVAVATKSDAAKKEAVCRDVEDSGKDADRDMSGTDASEPEEILPEYRTIDMPDRSGGPIEATLKDGTKVNLKWIEPGRLPDDEDDEEEKSLLESIPGGIAGIGAAALIAAGAAAIIIRKRRSEDSDSA